jgi:Zn-dependent membrane protease YugP
LEKRSVLFYYDPLFWMFAIPGTVLSIIAQLMVSSAYAKYKAILTEKGFSGAQAARALLIRYGAVDISVEEIGGTLSDHYDPSERVLRLSHDVYHGTSLAAVGIAAHEAGHAIQHSSSWAPMAVRSGILPVTQLASYIWMPLFFIGLMFLHGQMATYFVYGGVLLFSVTVLFQVFTLPIEFNASSRAMALLTEEGIISQEEANGTRKVLRAAALTYVAAAASAILTLMYLLLMAGGRRRDD